MHLLNPSLCLSLLHEYPAVQHSADRLPERKSLVLREANGGFNALLGSTHLTAELMEHRCTGQGKTQAKRVRNLLRQGYGFLGPCAPLLRIAQTPQRPRTMAAARHTSVVPIEDRRGTVLLQVVERYPLG